MECAAKGRGTRCIGPPTRRCGRCGAVAYCSVGHLLSHWGDHKEECARFEQQMRSADVLHDFPFTFFSEAMVQVHEKQETRCFFFMRHGLHQVGMWRYECHCGASVAASDCPRMIYDWNLPTTLCPCREPITPISMRLSNWKDYYEWRCLPLNSPVALLLHWTLTVYHAIQLAAIRNSTNDNSNKLYIHYLGPEKELLQLAVFGELRALFPGIQFHIDLIGPAVPQFRFLSWLEHPLMVLERLFHLSAQMLFKPLLNEVLNLPLRDGERINLCNYAGCMEIDCPCKSLTENASLGVSNGRNSAVTLQLHKGFYHEWYREMVKGSFPHLIVAANAGIAAYASWLPTIELIKEMNVPAIFSDYCEEAANLAARCLSSVTGHPLGIPIQLNPFRQPMELEDSSLFLPSYSNCFIFGM